MKICIDAGHGGYDAGAVNGAKEEEDANLALALQVGELLTKKGYEVIYTRTEDEYVELHDRRKLGNTCDIFVSIHCNASTNTNANGVETWYNKDDKLATCIQEQLKTLDGVTNRGIKQSDRLAVLKGNVPSALVEVGFISHAPTIAKFWNEYGKELISQKIFDGIVDFVIKYR